MWVSIGVFNLLTLQILWRFSVTGHLHASPQAGVTAVFALLQRLLSALLQKDLTAL